MTETHLLSRDASAFEKALAGSIARLSAIPAPIDLVKRPDEVPSAFLPFLCAPPPQGDAGRA